MQANRDFGLTGCQFQLGAFGQQRRQFAGSDRRGSQGDRGVEAQGNHSAAGHRGCSTIKQADVRFHRVQGTSGEGPIVVVLSPLDGLGLGLTKAHFPFASNCC